MALGHCVVAKAEYNWYLHDINITPYQKNNIGISCDTIKNYKCSSSYM
jgi:hypothetical protein